MDDSGTSGVMPVLLQVVEENAGMRLQASDSDASFFELGLDSLFLTQFSVSLAKRFGVSLTFRQLSSDFGNLRKLARFLDEAVAKNGPPTAAEKGSSRIAPAEPGRVVSPRVPAHQQPGGPVMDSEPLIQLFLRQIDVMQQQLDSLGTTVGLASLDQAGPPARYVEQENSSVIRAQGATSPSASIAPVSAIVLPPASEARLPEARPAASEAQPSSAQASSVATSASTTPPAFMAPSASAASAAAPRGPTGATPAAGREAGVGKVLDAARPPVPGARLGRDPSGQPAWFVPRADQPGKFVKLD